MNEMNEMKIGMLMERSLTLYVLPVDALHGGSAMAASLQHWPVGTRDDSC